MNVDLEAYIVQRGRFFSLPQFAVFAAENVKARGEPSPIVVHWGDNPLVVEYDAMQNWRELTLIAKDSWNNLPLADRDQFLDDPDLPAISHSAPHFPKAFGKPETIYTHRQHRDFDPKRDARFRAMHRSKGIQKGYRGGDGAYRTSGGNPRSSSANIGAGKGRQLQAQTQGKGKGQSVPGGVAHQSQQCQQPYGQGKGYGNRWSHQGYGNWRDQQGHQDRHGSHYTKGKKGGGKQKGDLSEPGGFVRTRETIYSGRHMEYEGQMYSSYWTPSQGFRSPKNFEVWPNIE